LKVTQGQGRFIPTPVNAEAVYGRVEAREVVSLVLSCILLCIFIEITFGAELLPLGC